MTDQALIKEHLGMFFTICEFIEKHLRILHVNLQTAWSKESSVFVGQSPWKRNFQDFHENLDVVHPHFWLQQNTERIAASVLSVNLKFVSLETWIKNVQNLLKFSGPEMAVPFYMVSMFLKKSTHDEMMKWGMVTVH